MDEAFAQSPEPISNEQASDAFIELVEKHFSVPEAIDDDDMENLLILSRYLSQQCEKEGQ